MRSHTRRLVTTVSVALAIAACEADEPIGPSGAEPLLSVSGSGTAAPSNLTATASAGGQVDLGWTDNSTNEAGFEAHVAVGGSTEPYSLWTTTGPNAVATSFTGLSASQTYCAKVRAFTAKGNSQKRSYSEFSNVACATIPAPPPPPPGPNAPSGTNVTALGGDAVNVTWIDNSDNETWFRLEHAPTSTGPWEFIGTLLGSGYTSYATFGLPSEQQICYRVFALNAQGTSAPSNVDCTTPPATPNPLTALWTAGPAVDLTWTDNSSVEDGYQVRRRSPAGEWIGIAELPPNATTYHDAGVSGDGTYYYVVRARKDDGFSYPSWEATPTDGTPRPPEAPGLYSADGYYLGTIWLAWYSNPATVESFKVERCDKETCEEADFRVIATVPVIASYTHSYQDGVSDWMIFTYRIRATNQVGDSPPSNQVQGRSCIEEVDGESPCWPPLPAPPTDASGALSPRRRSLIVNRQPTPPSRRARDRQRVSPTTLPPRAHTGSIAAPR
ncbi:MAG: hypothetical protein ABR499_19470 [Gemmatimonadaceae bacterium]